MVVALEPGATLIARLIEALTASPTAGRFVVAGAEPAANDELLSASAGYPVTVMGVAVADTCKEVVDGLVHRTVPRETVVDARGPWVFTREALAGALARVRSREGEIHDLVALSSAARLRVHVLVS